MHTTYLESEILAQERIGLRCTGREEPRRVLRLQTSILRVAHRGDKVGKEEAIEHCLQTVTYRTDFSLRAVNIWSENTELQLMKCYPSSQIWTHALSKLWL